VSFKRCWINEPSESHMQWAPFRAVHQFLLFSTFGCTAYIRFISGLHVVHTVSVCLTSSPRSNINLLFYLCCDAYFDKRGCFMSFTRGVETRDQNQQCGCILIRVTRYDALTMSQPAPHRTPLRRVSRGSLAAISRSGSFPDAPQGLGFMGPALENLSDETEALHANLAGLNALASSLETFNESFASYLFIQKVNVFCVEWFQVCALRSGRGSTLKHSFQRHPWTHRMS